MLNIQETLVVSSYLDIYEKVVPKDHLLRKIKELVDFHFVYDELKNEYSDSLGRSAQDPITMFKYLLLKIIYKISDVDVVERSKYDMSFKYFLDMAPEGDVINPSTLTKFRKLRLKNTNLLDLLINKTVTIALEKGIIKSNSIIVDSTHTKSRYNQKSARELLLDASKKLRKTVYSIDETVKDKFPKKVNNGILEDEIDYCQKLIAVIEKQGIIASYPAIRSKINELEELIEDDLEHLESIKDQDAKVGHKTADTSFFGYKTHIAMTEERIISAATVTSGEKHDGKELKKLVSKSKETGLEVKTIIGDGAYSEKENLEYAKEEKLELIAKLSKTVTHGNKRKSGEFEFNKDASMYVCKAGHMSIKKTSKRPKKHAKDGQGNVETYFFDVEKCRVCPQKEGCYRDGSKTKSYSVTIMSHTHQDHVRFQETEEFKEKARERYKIEAKNSELKHRHGYDVASSSGLLGMQMQGALTIFAVNLKRIIKLIDEK